MLCMSMSPCASDTLPLSRISVKPQPTLARQNTRYNTIYINDLHLMPRRERPVVPAQLNFKKQREELTRLPLGERFEHIIRSNLWAADMLPYESVA